MRDAHTRVERNHACKGAASNFIRTDASDVSLYYCIQYYYLLTNLLQSRLVLPFWCCISPPDSTLPKELVPENLYKKHVFQYSTMYIYSTLKDLAYL